MDKKTNIKKKRSCHSGHSGRTHSSHFPSCPTSRTKRVTDMTRQHGTRVPQLSAGTTARLSTPHEDLRSFKLILFCRSSGRWRDSPKFHKDGRSQLLPHLTRGCLYLRAPPRRRNGNRRSQTCLTSAHSSLPVPIPTSAGRTKN